MQLHVFVNMQFQGFIFTQGLVLILKKKALNFFQHNTFLLLLSTIFLTFKSTVKQFCSEINYEALNMFILQKLFFTYS